MLSSIEVEERAQSLQWSPNDMLGDVRPNRVNLARPATALFEAALISAPLSRGGWLSSGDRKGFSAGGRLELPLPFNEAIADLLKGKAPNQRRGRTDFS